jgi:hypothetical protein
MTQESSNIDKAFRDKLYDYQSDPKPEAWQKILEKLSLEEKLRRSKEKQILYYSIAAVSAITLVVSFSVYYFMQQETNSNLSSPQISVITPKDSSNNPKGKNTFVIPAKKTNASHTPVAGVIFKEEKTGDEKKKIYLPDGSTVILNRQSKIKYSSNFKTERILQLWGEAFFEVKPNAKLPFVVEGNFSKTRVVGTSFIIRTYQKDAFDEINVISGKVSFGQKMEKGKEMLILAGNKGTLKGNQTEQSVIKDINYNSWLTGKIVFKNTKLKEVFTVLEKYFNVSVKAKNPKILNCEFTGEFENSDINEILEVLSVSFSLSFNQESKNYLLSGKGCK